MKLKHTRDYREARRPEYPGVTDQLDAIWKALAVSGLNLPPETAAMLAKVRAVKAMYPKPGQGAA